MALKCSMCRKKRMGEKLSTAYWAWFLADQERIAWRLKYCLECARAELSLLSKAYSAMSEDLESSNCLMCGASTDDDRDPIYCTLYLPGKEPVELELELDGACAAKLRIPISDNGERLPDRQGSMRGPSSSVSAWDALGLGPSL